MYDGHDMENYGSDAKQIHRYTPPGLATTTLELAYGTTFLATTNTHTKLDAACTYPDLIFARLSVSVIVILLP